jgi:hypothetical protein
MFLQEVSRSSLWVATNQQGRRSGLLQGLKINLGRTQISTGQKKLCRPPNNVAFMTHDPFTTHRGLLSAALVVQESDAGYQARPKLGS